LKIEFRTSFAKDLKKIKEASVKKQVLAVISAVEQAGDLQEIENVKKLKGAGDYYRIRLGEYRLGLVLDKKTLIFVRFLHRKDIYRYFP
jgi:mRNA interferase RelE/StbE